ncbi:MAG: hypothetical protein KDD40_06385, partial [Bdellovibrionales bacterium]|nr:hypothetical protein [Bdellovibrionales bacterium]
QGKWDWFRLLHKHKMKLNFFREDQGSAEDQPYFVDWCNFKNFKNHQFAAVLGSPVAHSWTPEEQRNFWQKHECNALKIDLTAEELNQEVLTFLQKLGLKYAAVTAPLKSPFNSLCTETTDIVKEIQMVNTIQLVDGKVKGTNTDYHGFKTLCESQVLPRLNKPIEEWQVALWGGGGTLPIVKKLFPKLTHFSARTQKRSHNHSLLDKLKTHKNQFDILVWAVGRERMAQGAQFPSEDLQFTIVVDLNYTDSSPGKELAQRRGCTYISGEAMFRAQAAEQRLFWD